MSEQPWPAFASEDRRSVGSSSPTTRDWSGEVDHARDGKTFVMKFSHIDYNGDGTVYYDQGTGVSYGSRLTFPR
jgi:hypothetical protein